MKKGYSKYLRPLFLLADVLAIIAVCLTESNATYNHWVFIAYLTLFWAISSFFSGYYKVYRFTSVYRAFSQIIVQLPLFWIGFFAYFGLFEEGKVTDNQFRFLVKISISIFILKYLFLYLLRKYRAYGKNFRNIVFLELDATAKKMMILFQEKESLGYNVKGYFSNEKHDKSKNYLGDDSLLEAYTLQNEIDEVYASLSVLKKKKIKKLTKFCNQHNIQLKLIPNSNEFYSKSQKEEFYDGTFKVLTVKKTPFQFEENRIIKRIFDVVFSFFVIVFLMSWLVPILWILIKLESKGSLFFKQEREGLNGKKFVCYKFRSMKKNDLADKIHATKDDYRVTKIGKFIRKTSIDELPQFYNVFLGDMSVVGPRPHMNVHNEKYSKEVANYIERYAVKPGITGLAQISGYRGEIKKKSDIENRVRLDIFYIENWSFYFDIKIIIKTILNIFKGEEQAY